MTEHELKIEIDLDNFDTIGQSVLPIESDNKILVELQRKIQESIKDKFNNETRDFILRINDLVSGGNINDAFCLFKDSIDLVYWLNENQYANIKILSKLVNVEQLKYMSIYLVALSSRFNLIDELEEDVDVCLKLKDESMEENIEMSLYIEQSRIFYEKGKYNSSYLMIKKIIEESKDNSILGCAYRNLSRLASNDADFQSSSLKAIDHFIISGDKKSAISVIMLMLNKSRGKDNAQSLIQIKKAIELSSSDGSINKNKIASLYQIKASILIELKEYHEALKPLKYACELRRGLIGNELYLYSSLVKLERLYNICGEQKLACDIKNEYQKIELLINDEDFFDSRKILSVLENKDESVELNTLKLNVEDGAPVNIKLGYVLTKYLKEASGVREKISLLDDAFKYADELRDHEMKSLVLQLMANEYNVSGNPQQAICKLYESLVVNKYNYDSFQKLALLLQQENRLADLSLLLMERIRDFGELPNICFFYAKVLFELKDYRKAFTFFKKVKDNNGFSINVDEYIYSCISHVDELNVSIVEEKTKDKIDISLDDISTALDDFVIAVSNHSRMYFWTNDGKNYKWTSKPESVAKHLLLMFFASRFGSDELELIQEPRAGAGFIDLYFIAKNGIKVVIELKMCGSGYSSNYALSGESQIIHYLNSKEVNVGYLVIFDARTRDYANGVQAFKSLGKHTIYSKVVDLRPIIEK